MNFRQSYLVFSRVENSTRCVENRPGSVLSPSTSLSIFLRRNSPVRCRQACDQRCPQLKKQEANSQAWQNRNHSSAEKKAMKDGSENASLFFDLQKRVRPPRDEILRPYLSEVENLKKLPGDGVYKAAFDHCEAPRRYKPTEKYLMPTLRT